MKLPPLFDGVILRRYKRFLADVELTDGRIVTAHCPNTGSMRGCWKPGAAVQISHSDNPKRKLAWTLERVDMGQGWVGVHTGRTNPVIGEALQQERIVTLSGYKNLRSEVRFASAGGARARFDFLLCEGEQSDAWIEVKNVTLWEEDRLRFPDARTERGRKHLELLAEVCQQGKRGVMIYAINRPEGECFSPADGIDPDYGETLRRVVDQSGLEVLAVRIAHQSQALEAAEMVPVELS